MPMCAATIRLIGPDSGAGDKILEGRSRAAVGCNGLVGSASAEVARNYGMGELWAALLL